MTQSKRLIQIFFIALLVPTAFAGPVAEKKLNPADLHPEIATIVSNFMAVYHYQGANLDDNLSKRLFDLYIDHLDYSRMFFLASDIQEFKRYERQFDDELRMNPARLESAFAIYNRYRQRVSERVVVIQDLLEKNTFDFEVEEAFFFDRHKEPWANSEAELNDFWRRRLKEEILRFKLQDRPNPDYMTTLKNRYKRLINDLSTEEPIDVLERFLTSLTRSFDPHSVYFKPITKENFDIQMGHSLEGIGASLFNQGEYTVVASLVKGGPASRDGRLKEDDKIIAVAQGEDGEFEDVVDMRIDKVVKKIRGPKGTLVRLMVIPADAKDYSQTVIIPLVRDRVKLTAMDAKAELIQLKDKDDKSTKVGVISIPSFYLDMDAKAKGDPNFKSTTRDVRKLLQDLKGQGADAIVVDLRTNGGGSLDEAVELTGLFIDHGPVVQIRTRSGNIKVERDTDTEMVYDGPLMVLTSIFSASASEIFAGAIQDYDRGLVVGAESTHGKGTVQQVIGLTSPLSRIVRRQFSEDVAGALKLTTHKFYRVSGGSTQFKGVVPHIVLPSPYDGMKVLESDSKYALPWDEIQAVTYKDYDMVDDVVSTLRSESAKRVATNNEFKYVLEDTQERKTLRERNEVSLRLAQRQEERQTRQQKIEARDEARKNRVSPIEILDTFVVEKELNDDEDLKKEEETAEDKEQAEEESVPIPDYVLEESLFVLRDYLRLKKGNLIAGVEAPKEPMQ
jgi:carboxyl-terminal processing protease